MPSPPWGSGHLPPNTTGAGALRGIWRGHLAKALHCDRAPKRAPAFLGAFLLVIFASIAKRSSTLSFEPIERTSIGWTPETIEFLSFDSCETDRSVEAKNLSWRLS